MNTSQWIFAILVMQITGHLGSTTNRNLSRPKIVGGFNVKINAVPFLLSLHVRVHGFLCGAMIISEWWGMTALHCLKPGNHVPKHYYVRAGSSKIDKDGSIHRLRKFHSYDSTFYDGKTIPAHDILIFRVEKRFRFSSDVKPAKLPVEGAIAPELLRVSGWGRSDMPIEASELSVSLQTARLRRVAWKDCLAAVSWYEMIANERTHLCYGDETADACHGDSGGPLADFNTVYGIVSFGDGCGGSPGIYAKVSYYRRWIKRITKI